MLHSVFGLFHMFGLFVFVLFWFGFFFFIHLSICFCLFIHLPISFQTSTSVVKNYTAVTRLLHVTISQGPTHANVMLDIEEME